MREIIENYKQRIAKQEEDDVLKFNEVMEQDYKINDIVNREAIIYHAVNHASLQICQELISRNVELKFEEPNSNLMFALGKGVPFDNNKEETRIALLQLLVENGLDVNARDRAGYTILHWAVLNSMDKMTEILLSKYKMEVDCRDQSKNTPLQLLITQTHEATPLSTVEILLRYGADINAYDSIGSRPYTAAKNYPELKALMRKYGTPDKTLSENEISLQKLMRYAHNLGFYEREEYDYFSDDSSQSAESEDGKSEQNTEDAQELDASKNYLGLRMGFLK